MENQWIRLLPADTALAEWAAEYCQRNREFLAPFEPCRPESYYGAEHQRKLLEQEAKAAETKTGLHFLIQSVETPDRIIGTIALTNMVWGPFCSANLGYKLDQNFLNRGYMTMAVQMVTDYAFRELGLHRIEANVMPRNQASIRVLEKNGYENEGLSRYYLKINGIWEDHIHMVKLNESMHEM